MSFGFDNLIKFWDVNNSQNFFQGEIKLPLKTLTCSYEFPYLLIGSVESTIATINMKNLPNTNFPARPEDYAKTQL